MVSNYCLASMKRTKRINRNPSSTKRQSSPRNPSQWTRQEHLLSLLVRKPTLFSLPMTNSRGDLNPLLITEADDSPVLPGHTKAPRSCRQSWRLYLGDESDPKQPTWSFPWRTSIDGWINQTPFDHLDAPPTESLEPYRIRSRILGSPSSRIVKGRSTTSEPAREPTTLPPRRAVLV